MDINIDNNMILTIKDIMGILHVGRETVYKLINKQELKAVKIAGKYRTTKNAVYKYLENAMDSTDYNKKQSQCYNTVDCFYGTGKIPDAERSCYFNSVERNQK